MRTTNSPPPKADRFTCAHCGMTAVAPIVVRIDEKYARCANRQACGGRIRRTTNKAKETSNAK